ncbi:MAG: AsmA-like C-terminal region-containing protein, partial [Terriglobales bacterium]
LTGVSVGPLLRDALEKDLVEGRGDIGLDVTAAGSTVSALTRTLTGVAKLGLKDGAIKGINLAQSLRSAKDMLATNRTSESAASPTEKTDFSELAASFTIKDGKAHNDDLSVKSPFLRLTGAGDIDIAAGALDYVAKASVVATSTGQTGKELADVAGLTIPVRVSGPVNALNYKLEFGDAIAQRAKQQLQEKKDALRGRLESELRDKLLGATKPPPSAAPQGEAQDSAQDAQPAAKPEEQVKKRLKDLFR